MDGQSNCLELVGNNKAPWNVCEKQSTSDQGNSGKYTWKYCPTTSNPADLLSRGTDYSKLLQNDLWFKGPSWIADKSKWPVWNRKDTHILANVTEAGKSTDVEEQIEEETSMDSDKGDRKISKIIDI